MKQGIHPEYKKARVSCGCGNVLETHNTVGDLTVEICSACHPFFTGKQKLVDTAGRVDKFRAKMEKAEKLKSSKQPKKAEKKETIKGVKKLNKKTRLRKDASDGQVPEIEEKLRKKTVDIQQESQEEKTDNKPKEANESTDN